MTTVLEDFSNNLASLVQSAGPSVVRVEGRRRLSASGIIFRQDGLIVTANHVVERDDNLAVGLSDGSKHDASVVGRDHNRDLALLRIDASDLPAASWIAPDDLSVGHIVLALGRPGKTVQATWGVVSALGGSWRTGAGGEIDRYLQTDVAMYPGFSGGPLLTANGQFAGLNSSSLLRGISVTVPSSTIGSVVNTLLTHGHMPRGYLGIGVQPVRLAESLHAKLDQETGLMVMSVESESPASAANLNQGDILVAFDGNSLRQIDDLQSHLASTTIDQEVTLTVIRSGNQQSVTVGIGQSK